MAVAILGLSLTVILSAQAGLFASTTHSKNETIAVGMVRCKMGEIEEDLLRNGYQELDVLETGECCEDNTPRQVRCRWNIDRVELPDPLSFGEFNPAGGASLDLTTQTGGLEALSSGAGPLGLLAGMGSGSGGLSSLGSEGGLSAISSALGQATTGGVAGLAPMVMSIVYPSFKPMLEASIRKVTVTVLWKEGINDRELSITQYVTNPMRGGLGMTSEQMELLSSGSGQGLPTGSALGGLGTGNVFGGQGAGSVFGGASRGNTTR